MKKLFWLLLLIGAITTAKAQVLINLQLPPSGMVVKNQLWNLSLVNTSNSPLNIQIQVVLTELAGNRCILTGTSKTITLSKGIKQIQAAEVMPVNYNAGTGYNAGPDGFLPVGQFSACFTVVGLINDGTERLAEECTTLEVEPISPPQLVMPADSAAVEEPRPLFTWLPPAPYTLFNNLLYDWVLVEVQATQSAADAIQQNVPVFFQSNISFTSLQYPLSMPELDTGKLYAWRVTAKNNLSPIANSEVWCFRIQKNANDTFKAVNKGFYTPLRRELGPSYVITNSTIRFLYLHEMNSYSVQVKITDINKTAQQVVQLDSAGLAVKFGANYLSLDLSNAGLTDKHMYLLDVTNDRSEHWYLKFEYRQQQ